MPTRRVTTVKQSNPKRFLWVIAGVILILVVFFNLSASDTQQEQTAALKDALRKCTVMEAADIHTTGFGAKSGNAFNDGLDTCSNYFLPDVYKGDEAVFIADVNTDWNTRNGETIDGKNLEYYVGILGW